MRSIAISDFKARLSENLRRVTRGESLLITDRGQPLVRVVPLDEVSADPTLTRLERDGVLRRGTAKLSRDFWQATRPCDESASLRAAVTEEREQGW